VSHPGDPDWDDDPEPANDSPEPPEWWLEEEARRHAEIHNGKRHGDGPCDCPTAEPEYDGETPF
jgi:hypothetical protein